MTPTRVARADTAALARLDELAAERGMALGRNILLGPLTTLRVGGPADRLVLARDREELLATLRLARDAAVPCFVLGNGSDLVVADAGVRGLVVRNRARSVAIDGAAVRADAGAAMAMLVRRTVTAGLAGLEFGISIPGTLGGAVWANAGAHEGEVAGIVTGIEAWDPAEDRVVSLAPRDCAFAYRESRFKHSAEVVLGADLELRPGDPGASARLVAEHRAQRQATQPLADQNAGSVFRNPPGDHAGRLIEAAGLKGQRIGTASVSTLHANFIVTDGAGRAADVRALADRVRAVVAERFGVALEFEIVFAGDWSDQATL
ncbi:MAG TPA: UDP-N-acetylmuramate dehydrogenase [Candidatus Limnocylindria bacterium]|nr:UDP-N-acetylmuramate dehydrogenase [Candidatus Limnocylindria bacterium]